jgi:hypothetical protein
MKCWNDGEIADIIVIKGTAAKLYRMASEWINKWADVCLKIKKRS